ncbi:hypothetical protein BLOT_014123 [Blomia tropicalis]|nr:hypothetical protein BLOT_014123 [Blomia tropicalis]
MLVSTTIGVPPEPCIISHHCNSYCRSFGYERGLCRTRIHYGTIAPVKRTCLCTKCSEQHCRVYCLKIGRKSSGCSCFSFSQRTPPLMNRNELNIANDCNNDVLYCQCSI